jgi:two-component system response regulator HydG
LLVDHFLDKYCHETTKHVDRVSPDALALLRAYDWPGNVRELENAMERAVVLSRSRTLSERDFSFLSAGSLSLPAANTSLQDLEKRYIQQVLEETGWNVTRAAQILGINRVTLHKKLNRYRIERPER